MVTTRNAPVMVLTGKLTIQTGAGPDFIEITPPIVEFVRASGLRQGLALVYSQHTTAAIVIHDRAPASLQELADLLNAAAPPTAEYRHNDFTVRTVNMTEFEVPNGHSHCQHLLLRTSETIPVIDGDLVLGEGQGIFLIELDHPRTRDVIIQLVGE